MKTPIHRLLQLGVAAASVAWAGTALCESGAPPCAPVQLLEVFAGSPACGEASYVKVSVLTNYSYGRYTPALTILDRCGKAVAGVSQDLSTSQTGEVFVFGTTSAASAFGQPFLTLDTPLDPSGGWLLAGCGESWLIYGNFPDAIAPAIPPGKALRWSTSGWIIVDPEPFTGASLSAACMEVPDAGTVSVADAGTISVADAAVPALECGVVSTTGPGTPPPGGSIPDADLEAPALPTTSPRAEGGIQEGGLGALPLPTTALPAGGGVQDAGLGALAPTATSGDTTGACQCTLLGRHGSGSPGAAMLVVVPLLARRRARRGPERR